MRNAKRTILSLLVFSLATTVAEAQRKGDCQAVKGIPSGSLIKVYAAKNTKCYFQYADDENLFCVKRKNSFVTPPPLTFERSTVREVHREHPEINADIGTVIGGVAGFAGGGEAAPALAFLAGAVGRSVGRHVPLVRGTVVYKR